MVLNKTHYRPSDKNDKVIQHLPGIWSCDQVRGARNVELEIQFLLFRVTIITHHVCDGSSHTLRHGHAGSGQSQLTLVSGQWQQRERDRYSVVAGFSTRTNKSKNNSNTVIFGANAKPYSAILGSFKRSILVKLFVARSQKWHRTKVKELERRCFFSCFLQDVHLKRKSSLALPCMPQLIVASPH